MHQKHYPTFTKWLLKKKVRKNSVENSFQAQNKTAKFLASKAKHARHITYKSIIQLASQKKFWHKHGMKKKTFAFSRTKWSWSLPLQTTRRDKKVDKSSIFQLESSCCSSSTPLKKSIIHQSLYSSIPNSLIFEEALLTPHATGKGNSFATHFLWWCWWWRWNISYDIWLRHSRNTMVVPMTVVTIFTLPLFFSCFAMLLSLLSSPSTSRDNKKGMQNGSSRKGQSKKCHVQLVMDNNSTVTKKDVQVPSIVSLKK